MPSLPTGAVLRALFFFFFFFCRQVPTIEFFLDELGATKMQVCMWVCVRALRACVRACVPHAGVFSFSFFLFSQKRVAGCLFFSLLVQIIDSHCA